MALVSPSQECGDSNDYSDNGGKSHRGRPKYRKLSTTPTTCTAKNTQPSAPIAAGAEVI
jgi:hypothetical protein